MVIQQLASGEFDHIGGKEKKRKGGGGLGINSFVLGQCKNLGSVAKGTDTRYGICYQSQNNRRRLEICSQTSAWFAVVGGSRPLLRTVVPISSHSGLRTFFRKHVTRRMQEYNSEGSGPLLHTPANPQHEETSSRFRPSQLLAGRPKQNNTVYPSPGGPSVNRNINNS